MWISRTGLSKHFASKGHSFEDDAALYILERGQWKNAEERRCKESFYICKYSTLEQKGRKFGRPLSKSLTEEFEELKPVSPRYDGKLSRPF